MVKHPEVIDLYLDPDHMKLMNCDGYVVFDVFRMIPPSVFYLFLERKETMMYEAGYNVIVNLFYPEEDEW